MDTLTFWQHSLYTMPWWQSVLISFALAGIVFGTMLILKRRRR